MQNLRLFILLIAICNIILGCAFFWLGIENITYNVVCFFTLFILTMCYYLLYSKMSLMSLFSLISFFIIYALLLEYPLEKFVAVVNQRESLQFSIGSTDTIAFISVLLITSFSGYIYGLLYFKPITNGKDKVEAPGLFMKPMSIRLYWIVSIVLIVLKYILAPKGTIFSSGYADIRTTSLATNTSGLASLDFVISCSVILLMIDFLNEWEKGKRKSKAIALFIVIAFVIFILEFLKGERTSIGLLFSLFFMYVTYNGLANFKKRFKLLFMPFCGILISFFMLSYLRQIANNSKIASNIDLDFYKNGTWIGAFYSTVGLADEFNRSKNNFTYLYGTTYWSYIPSMLPEVFSRSLGIDRAIDSAVGNPARWYDEDYTQGGVSFLVPAFKNWGIIGGAFVSFLFALFISKVEKSYLMRQDIKNSFLYGIVGIFLLRWFWYGDIYIIRGLMIYILFYYILRWGGAIKQKSLDDFKQKR